MIISSNRIYEKCYGSFAVPAINVFNIEQIIALFEAANECAAPFICQTTPHALNYAGKEILIQSIVAAVKQYPKVVCVLHLDHGTEEFCNYAINQGNYASVMIDASHETFIDNISITKRIVSSAHKNSINVEAELGVLSGIEDDMIVGSDKQKYTDPDEAKQFVEETQCDSLAVAVGTSHGVAKFKNNQGINFSILNEIRNKLLGYPLVLHGASLIKKEDIDDINKYGGSIDMDSTGVSYDQISKAISMGVCKINIATDLRVLWMKVYRKFLSKNRDKVDFTLPGIEYKKLCKELIVEKFERFNTVGKNKLF